MYSKILNELVKYKNLVVWHWRRIHITLYVMFIVKWKAWWDNLSVLTKQRERKKKEMINRDVCMVSTKYGMFWVHLHNMGSS